MPPGGEINVGRMKASKQTHQFLPEDSSTVNERADDEWLYPGEGTSSGDLGESVGFSGVPGHSIPVKFGDDTPSPRSSMTDGSPRELRHGPGSSTSLRFSKAIGYKVRDKNFEDHNYNSRNAGLENPIPRSERALLCGRMLEGVFTSTTKFKPSASIAATLDLMQYATQREEPQIEIDIVMTGGGLKGYYMAGASYVLLHELEKQNVRIARVAGASAGAWAGFFMLTGFSCADWIETYFGCAKNLQRTLLEAYEDMWPFVKTLIPEDAYIHCSGKLFISLTEVTVWGLRNRMVSQYDSNEDLFCACLASSTIPYLTVRSMVATYKNMWVLDGGFTNNTPIFDDGVRRQLVFRLYEVEYPWRLLTNASDTCIEALVLRGAILMSRFLQGDPAGDGSISWLERKDAAQSSSSGALATLRHWLRFRPMVLIRMLLTPITVSVMVAGRGLRNLLRVCGLYHPPNLGSKGEGDSIVPFHHAQRDSGSSYLRWVLWGSLVERLQRLGFLL